MAMGFAGEGLVGSSSRRASGFMDVWNEPADAFRRSREVVDEEEELRWAAIERLPTYDRVRKGLLKQVVEDGKVVHNEIDLKHMGRQEKKHLADMIQKFVDEDNEKFLRTVKERVDRVGIESPTIEVRYEHLSVEGNVHVGSRALPTLLNATMNAIEATLGLVRIAPSKKRQINILQDISGIVKPSRMTLLLGPPASGKTTLLLALAGKLDKDLKVTGKITYCGHEFNEFVPQRTCAYISQHDLHNGEMTVRETLDFSGRCLGVGTRYDMLAELSRREKEAGIKPDPEIDALMKSTAMEGQETTVITDYVLKVNTYIGATMTTMHHRTIADGGKYFGALFFSLLNVMFNGMAELAMTVFRIPVFHKQRDFLFYPPWAYGLPIWVLRIPLSFVESAIWIILTYYTIGFAPAASRFFRQFLAYFCIHQMALGLFRFLGAVGRTLVVANTIGISTLLLVFVLGGFIIAKAMVGFSLLFNVLFVLALTYLNPFGDSKAIIPDDNNDPKKNKPLSAQAVEGAQRRGMVLPFQPLSLAFNHINYYVDMPAVSR
ncbi:hypothetical protein Ancab_014335 [Ancistrocladus abbreviatus]